MICVRVTTTLQAPLEHVWELLKKPSTYAYLSKGIVGFSQHGIQVDTMHEGDINRMKLMFFHIIPGQFHEIRIIRIDEERHLIQTNEHGGVVSVWNHELAVTRISDQSCFYSDTIDIEAGVFTLFVKWYAHLFYRYRQRRLRRMVTTNTHLL